jgi:hypothetical protein
LGSSQAARCGSLCDSAKNSAQTSIEMSDANAELREQVRAIGPGTVTTRNCA